MNGQSRYTMIKVCCTQNGTCKKTDRLNRRMTETPSVLWFEGNTLDGMLHTQPFSLESGTFTNMLA